MDAVTRAHLRIEELELKLSRQVENAAKTELRIAELSEQIRKLRRKMRVLGLRIWLIVGIAAFVTTVCIVGALVDLLAYS